MSSNGIFSGDSDLEENEVAPSEKGSKTINFVSVVVKYKILFEKSQLPSILEKKEKAVQNCIDDLMKDFGEIYNKKNLMKKISKIKNDVKVKSDKNRTGNKKVILKSWEKAVLEIIGKDDNPTINKIPGALEVGAMCNSASKKPSNEIENPKIPSRPQLPPRPLMKAKLNEYETEETKNLSNSELQRLVLLEQLSYFRLKKARLE